MQWDHRQRFHTRIEKRQFSVHDQSFMVDHQLDIILNQQKPFADRVLSFGHAMFGLLLL